MTKTGTPKFVLLHTLGIFLYGLGGYLFGSLSHRELAIRWREVGEPLMYTASADERIVLNDLFNTQLICMGGGLLLGLALSIYFSRSIKDRWRFSILCFLIASILNIVSKEGVVNLIREIGLSSLFPTTTMDFITRGAICMILGGWVLRRGYKSENSNSRI